MKFSVLFVVLFTWVSNLNAQNWETIVPNDTNYFRVVTPVPDSVWDGYVRRIYADSTIIAGNAMTNYFYPSIRDNALNVVDTLHGDTWLGKKNIRNNLNGEEIYFNKYGDSLLIRTWSLMGDSWTLCTDNNGIEYIASVGAVVSTTLEGVPDSLKYIVINAYSGGIPITSYYNNFSFVLSKNHGWYQCLEIYSFPYETSPSWNKQFPILPFLNTRIEKSVLQTDFNQLDLSWKYKPGNEWIYFSYAIPSPGSYMYEHDSIISSSLISPDTLMYSYRKKTFLHEVTAPSNGPSVITDYLYDTILVDTTFRHPYILSFQGVDLEHKKRYIDRYLYPGSSEIEWFGYGKLFCNKLTYKYSRDYHNSLSGFGNAAQISVKDFGSKYAYFYFTDIVNVYGHHNNLIYAYLDGCVEGTKISLKNLSSVEELERSIFSMFPNPTTSSLYLKHDNSIIVLKIELLDLGGRKLMETTNVSFIDMQSLNKGIYFVRLYTNEGIFVEKCIKQ